MNIGKLYKEILTIVGSYETLPLVTILLAILVLAAGFGPAPAGAGIEVLAVSPRLIMKVEPDFWTNGPPAWRTWDLGINAILPCVRTIPARTHRHRMVVREPAGRLGRRVSVRGPGPGPGSFRTGPGIHHPGRGAEARAASRDVPAADSRRRVRGRGRTEQRQPPFPQCMLCHEAIVTQWEDPARPCVGESSRRATLGSILRSSCFQCHTVGFNADATVSNGGFSRTAKEMGADLSQQAGQVNDAFRKTTMPTRQTMCSTTKPWLPNCAPRPMCNARTATGRAASTSAIPPTSARPGTPGLRQCHDSMGFDGYPYPFDSSHHKTLTAALQNNQLVQFQAARNATRPRVFTAWRC